MSNHGSSQWPPVPYDPDSFLEIFADRANDRMYRLVQASMHNHSAALHNMASLARYGELNHVCQQQMIMSISLLALSQQGQAAQILEMQPTFQQPPGPPGFPPPPSPPSLPPPPGPRSLPSPPTPPNDLDSHPPPQGPKDEAPKGKAAKDKAAKGTHPQVRVDMPNGSRQKGTQPQGHPPRTFLFEENLDSSYDSDYTWESYSSDDAELPPLLQKFEAAEQQRLQSFGLQTARQHVEPPPPLQQIEAADQQRFHCQQTAREKIARLRLEHPSPRAEQAEPGKTQEHIASLRAERSPEPDKKQKTEQHTASLQEKQPAKKQKKDKPKKRSRHNKDKKYKNEGSRTPLRRRSNACGSREQPQS